MMSSSSTTLPTPLEPLPKDVQDKRLWIGNLDTRLNEYQLLKILQRFGQIEKFDLLFHRSGPLDGQPRGYAFVTYKESERALEAKTKLHGKKLGSKQVSVKWAHTMSGDEYDKSKQIPEIPALAGGKKPTLNNASRTIQAIEAKLRLMKNSPSADPDFTERPTLVVQPTPWSIRQPAQERNSQKTYRERHHNSKSRPYRRPKWR